MNVNQRIERDELCPFPVRKIGPEIHRLLINLDALNIRTSKSEIRLASTH